MKVSFQCQAIPPDWDLFVAKNSIAAKFFGNALDFDAIGKFRGVKVLRAAGGDQDFHKPAQLYADYVCSVLDRFRNAGLCDYAEHLNEPVPDSQDDAKYLNQHCVDFARIMHSRGYKVIGYNFSVGQPKCRFFDGDATLWPNMVDGVRASDLLGLHEYSAPAMQDRGDAYCLRYVHVLDELQALGVSPNLAITECGIDRGVIAGILGGYRANPTPIQTYTGQLRWYADSLEREPRVKYAFVFLAGRSDARWQSFDVSDDEADRRAFLDFLGYQAVQPPVQGDLMTTRLDTAWKSIGVIFNPTTAFYKKAQTLKLGYPVGNEYQYTAPDGTQRILQGYKEAFLDTKLGEFNQDQIQAFDWLTGQLWVPSTNPPDVIPSFAIPPALTSIGASAFPGNPTAPLYRLMGASVRQGVSAFCKVTVYGKNGLPAIGTIVCNLFPDKNGEFLLTDGTGTVTFNYGASSAFTPPAPGPFTIFIADSAHKDDGPPKQLVWGKVLSDTLVSVGDPNGTHTELYVQLAQVL